MSVSCVLDPPGIVMLAQPEVPRNAEGRKGKAALSNRGRLEQRGKQHTQYKGPDALKHNSEPGHLGRCMAYRGGAMQEFSEVRGYKLPARHWLYTNRDGEELHLALRYAPIAVFVARI
jgi:hypothetical protein